MWQCSLALNPGYALVDTHVYKIPGYDRVQVHVVLTVDAGVEDILFLLAGVAEKCN
jgi:hypothetical protein